MKLFHTYSRDMSDRTARSEDMVYRREDENRSKANELHIMNGKDGAPSHMEQDRHNARTASRRVACKVGMAPSKVPCMSDVNRTANTSLYIRCYIHVLASS